MPIPALVGAAMIGGGASLLSGLLGSSTQSNENAKQYARQIELQRMQQNYNTSMWNATNEYNKPSNQLALYTQAGINPNTAVNAISGNSGATQPATPAVPSVSSTGSSADKLSAGLQAAVQNISAIGQMQLLRGQIKQLDLQNQSQDIANQMASKDLEAKDEFIKLNKDMMSANIRADLASADLSNAQKFKLEYEAKEILPIMKQKTVEERNLIAQQIAQGVEQLKNLVATGQLLGEQIKTQRATQAQIYEQIRGQKFENSVRELHAHLASEFGLDLNSGAIQLLVELALSGDEKSSSTVNRIISTMCGAVSGLVNPSSDATSSLPSALNLSDNPFGIGLRHTFGMSNKLGWILRNFRFQNPGGYSIFNDY